MVPESLDWAAKLLSEKCAVVATRFYPQKTTCLSWTFCPFCFSWDSFQIPFFSWATHGPSHHLAQLGPSSHSTSLRSCNMRDLRDRIHPTRKQHQK